MRWRRRLSDEDRDQLATALAHAARPEVVGVLPAGGWVAERWTKPPTVNGVNGLHPFEPPNDVHECVPLVGWQVFSDGSMLPLPRLDDTWNIRPMMDGDRASLARTAQARRQGRAQGLFGPALTGVDDAR